MAMRLTLRTNIRVNGQEYESVDAMPADVRQAYERALASLAASQASAPANAAAGGGQPAVNTRVVFNGQTYASASEMPADVRELYEHVLATIETKHATPSGSEPTGPPPGAVQAQPAGVTTLSGLVKPESTSPRLLMIAGALIAFLILSVLYGRSQAPAPQPHYSLDTGALPR